MTAAPENGKQHVQLSGSAADTLSPLIAQGSFCDEHYRGGLKHCTVEPRRLGSPRWEP